MLIYFATKARLVWSAPVNYHIPDYVWKIIGGFTNYGPPLKLAFQHMSNKKNNEMYIKNYDYALMCFYTDGSA